jgi:hypothetical protein
VIWALHDHTPRAAQPAPQPDLLRLFWKMQAPSGKVLSCGLYSTAAGLEVRCDYGGDDLIRSQFAADPGTAGEVAAAWKMTALSKAGFLELDGGEGA